MKRALAGATALLLSLFAASATPQTIPFNNVAVGNGPEVDIADTIDGKVFVVNFGSNSVSVIDPVTWTKTTDIPTGTGPRRARINNTTHKIYVVNSPGASVTVINAATNAVITTIPLAGGSNPWNLAIDETHNKVYVALRGANQVAVIDGATDTLVTPVATGNSPRAVCVNTTTNRVYIPAFSSNNVTVLDGATNTPVAGSPITVGAGPTQCLVDEPTNRIFISNDTDGTFTPINGASNTAGTAITSGGLNTSACTLNQVANLLVMVNGGNGTTSLFQLDTLAPIKTLSTGGGPFSCFIDPTPGILYVTNRTDNTMSVISLWDNTLRQQVPTGTNPQGLARYFQNFYVVNQNGGGAGSVSLVKRFDLRKTSDMNGDGKGDLLWRNGSDGSIAGWLMNGVSATASSILIGPGAWKPVIKGDLDGDGNGDIVWRNTSTNETAIWLMNGLAPKPGGAAIVLGPSTYFPLMQGSFDGNAPRAILWVDSASGKVVIWLMGGLHPSYAQTIYSGSPAWTPILLGNFNGDFHSDIVWRNTDGSVAIWLMQGDANAGLSVKASATILGPGTSWVPTFIGDFDGDGRSDIVWSNTSTGDTAIWLMNGLSPKPGGTAIIMSGTTGWVVTGTPDLDGDLKSDLVWRNLATGATAAWLMNGLAAKPGGAKVLVTDPNWVALQTRDTAGQLQADLVWQNTATGATALWIMNGLSATTAAILTGSGPWSVVQYFQQ